MTVEELIVYGKSQISSMHAKMLLADLLSVNPLELLTILDNKIENEIVEDYKRRVEAAKKNLPIQYVIGSVNFYGEKFLVNENVLIPRFETEELVENVVEYIKKKTDKNLKVLDLGCGSGNIGLTLKRLFPSLSVTLVDVSEEALKVAMENAKKQNLDVNFLLSDWFSKVEIEPYDIIVSNPPYLSPTEEIDPIVKDNEPSLALYGGEDGLSCYRAILKNIKPYLKEDSFLAFEIGDKQKDAILSFIDEYLKDFRGYCKDDLQGRNRFLFVTKKLD